MFHVVEKDRSAPSLSPPVCVNQSSENLLISLITSNFSETCQAGDHAEERELDTYSDHQEQPGGGRPRERDNLSN